MIRPRIGSPWHDYDRVFDDLRSGRLSMIEYETMVDEDAAESVRRRVDSLGAGAVAMVADQKREAKRRYEVGRKVAGGLCAPSIFSDRMA